MAKHKKKKRPKRHGTLRVALIIGGATLLLSSAEGTWCCHDPGHVAMSLDGSSPPTIERECVDYKIDPYGPPLNEPPFRP